MATHFVLRFAAQPVTQLLAAFKDAQATDAVPLPTPFFKASVWVASPQLADETKHYPPKTRVVNKALWKYFIRQHSRATPFGLFAAVSLGTLAKEQRCTFASLPWDIQASPDSLYVHALTQHLRTTAFRYLTYRLNNTLYDTGTDYRFSERVQDQSGNITNLSLFARTTALDQLVDLLRRHDVLSYEAIFAYFDQDEAFEPFFQQLIDCQFVQSTADLTVTGEAIASQLLTHLQQAPELASLAQAWQAVQAALQFVQPDDTLRHVGEQIAGLIQQVTKATPSSPPLHVNLFGRFSYLTLPQDLVARLQKDITTLVTWLGSEPSTEPMLTTFAKRFRERYAAKRVPLLQVLDPDFGVGYSSDAMVDPLLADLPLPPDPTPPPEDRLIVLRNQLLYTYQLTKEPVYALTEADLKAQNRSPTLTRQLPASWYALGSLYQTDQAASFLLKYAGGPSALNLIGRFCHGDNQLADMARSLAQQEQQKHPNRLLAEIAFQPHFRSANIVARPVLRPYEIPILSPPGPAAVTPIALADLYVELGPDNRVELWSESQQRYVLPRLSTAHATELSDEIYRFLVAISQQDGFSVPSIWGSLTDSPRLPRITFGSLILERAQWRLRKDYLTPPPTTVAELRQVYELPQYVVLANGDNELVLDLDVPICRELLMDEWAKQDSLTLLEWLDIPDRCWLTDAGHAYASELLLPFSNSQFVEPPLPPVVSGVDSVKEQFRPGEDWFYVKVYASSTAMDRLLTEFVGPLVTEIMVTGLGTSWFFIRYSDPDPHIRLRITTTAYAKVLTLFNQRLAEYPQATVVIKTVLDTYQREVTRYEPGLIEAAEQLFFADSQAIVAWLTAQPTPPLPERLRYALQHADSLLSRFFALEKKAKLALGLQASYLAQAGGLEQTRTYLNQHYRLLDLDKTSMTDIPDSLRDYQEACPYIGQTVTTYFRDRQISEERLDALVISYLHMAMNRLFPDPSFSYELLVYHCLARFYRSRQARQDSR